MARNHGRLYLGNRPSQAPTKAVELLRHMPYIDREYPWVAPDAFVLDYLSFLSGKGRAWFAELSIKRNRIQGDRPGFPPWVVQLTDGKDREAALYMLDTMDGTVTKYITTGPVYPDPPGLYGHDDPGAWRGDWCFDTKGAD